MVCGLLRGTQSMARPRESRREVLQDDESVAFRRVKHSYLANQSRMGASRSRSRFT